MQDDAGRTLQDGLIFLVHSLKGNYRLGDDIQSKVLAFAFSLSAEIERDLISLRTRETLARKKAEEIKLGRPKGRKNNFHSLDGLEKRINTLYEMGLSTNKIAKLFGISRNSLNSFLKKKNS